MIGTGPKGATRQALRWLEYLAWPVLVGAYLWRVWAIHSAVPTAQVFHDTEFYFAAAAKNAYFSSGIWAGERSPLALFVFKCCATDPERVRQFFVVSSVLSWLALAAAVALNLRARSLRIAGAFLVLWLAVSRDVVSWNDVVLSESLSFSCAALFAACALCFFRRPRVWLGPLFASALLFALSRDSNAYLVLFSGLLWLAVAAYRAARRQPYRLGALAGVACCVVFLISNASANQGERWQYPLTNVIVSRVLPKASTREQFVALGMPQSYALRAGRPRRTYDADPNLKEFRDWLSVRGKHAYIHYLLANPRYTLSAPMAELLGANMDRYAPKGIDAAGHWGSDLVWLRSGWWWRLAALPVLSVLVLVLVRWRATLSPFAIVGLALAALTYPHALLLWHGDTMDLRRHGLTAAFQVELALLCLLLAAAEAALAKRSAPRLS